MLYQSDFYLENSDLSRLGSELCVKIHGYIMSVIDSEYAESLHKQCVKPFSTFAVPAENCYILRISALSDSASGIITAINNCDKFRIKGVDDILVLKVDEKKPIEFDELCDMLPERKYRINIVTPAFFKANNRAQNLPMLKSYFASVVSKMNKYSAAQITKEDFDLMFSRLIINDYRFASVSYHLAETQIPSMVGSFEFSIDAPKREREKIAQLLCYASFSGIGGKTAMGMGGITIEKV